MPSPIVIEPNNILRKKAAAVPLSDIAGAKIQRLIASMKKTLAAAPDGVGLAAPQVGQSLQIFIVSSEAEEIDRIEREARDRKARARASGDADAAGTPRQWRYYVFINPVVKNASQRKIERAEGCLSVPGKFGDVKRFEKITVEAHDENGKKFTRGSSRFFARVIQHELDHLSGVLFIDRTKKLFAPSSSDNM